MKSNHHDIPYDYEVAIIGAGFAGIGAGLKLKMKGHSSFIIFEKADSVGGTWRDNTYPGCACDIPSFLYSYSFIPNPNWTRSFSRQAEIYEYLKACVRNYDLEQHIRYQTEISSVVFDEAQGIWTISAKNGTSVRARMVISSAGPFNAPFIPNLKGQDRFKGETFHSLTWNHDYDLRGKKVAVIGTGASAIQFVPEIAPLVKELHLFQRTPPWIIPKLDQEITAKSQQRFKKFPWYQRFWREFIYWFLEYRGRAFFGNEKMKAIRKKEALEHLHNSIQDPVLRQKLTPDYEVGCKRVLISDNYYPTLTQNHVHLVDSGVMEVRENGVIGKDGKLIEVDAIIYGTGFYTTEFPNIFKVIGLNNRDLFEEFNVTGPEAYYGMTMNGFPNFTFMVGPNSGLGHNSIIHMIESELNYILDYLDQLQQTKAGTYFDLKKDVQRAFNEDIQAQLAKMVWSDGGCKSYYLVNNNGKNSSLWPGSTMSYRKQTKKVKLKDYVVVEAR